MKCPHCFSDDVQIVTSYEQRDVTVIACRHCGRQSEMDVENVHVDPKTGQGPSAPGTAAPG